MCVYVSVCVRVFLSPQHGVSSTDFNVVVEQKDNDFDCSSKPEQSKKATAANAKMYGYQTYKQTDR